MCLLAKASWITQLAWQLVPTAMPQDWCWENKAIGVNSQENQAQHTIETPTDKTPLHMCDSAI
jgi:hypothetical protein